MTIYFDGHAFKYEIEGVCKLFFPLVRFQFVYDVAPGPEVEDCIWTRRVLAGERARLSVEVRLEEQSRRRETELEFGGPRYEAECERQLCRLLFELLSEWLGVRPGWGILTGVRPVNILQKERRAGKSDAEIAAFLERDYLVTPRKIALAMQTADVQEPILADFSPRS